MRDIHPLQPFRPLPESAKGKIARLPNGEIMTINDLPPSNTTRWVMSRKAIVVHAVRGELITVEEACARYRLSAEEFDSWGTLLKEHGYKGLRTTRVQEYRKSA